MNLEVKITNRLTFENNSDAEPKVLDFPYCNSQVANIFEKECFKIKVNFVLIMKVITFRLDLISISLII